MRKVKSSFRASIKALAGRASGNRRHAGHRSPGASPADRSGRPWATSYSKRPVREAADHRRNRRASKALRAGRSPESRLRCCGSTGCVEERAAATVPASIGDASQAEVITPGICVSGDGAFLGIERPTVPVGDAAYPVLSTIPEREGAVHRIRVTRRRPTPAFVANTLAPERLQASFSYRRTDAARFAGLDASLRLALNPAGSRGSPRRPGDQRHRWPVDRQRICPTTMSRR